MDPRLTIRSWAPHLVLLVLLVGTLGWLLSLLDPLLNGLLMGLALTLLTRPVLHPLLNRGIVLVLPGISDHWHRHVEAGLATVLLLALLGGIMGVVMWAALGDLWSTVGAAWGLLRHDGKAVTLVLDAVEQRAATILNLYPDLPITAASLRADLAAWFAQGRVGPEFLKLVAKGTGSALVSTTIAFTTLFYAWGHGDRLAAQVLTRLPLGPTARLALSARVQHLAGHLLAVVAARALVLGLSFGVLAWIIAGFNPVLVAVPAVVLCLLPLVGPSFVWLALASLLATQGRWLEAGAIASACLGCWFLVEQAANRIAVALGTDEVWLGFLLFLSMVAGVIAHGLGGLVLGPAAVLVLGVLIEAWSSLYGGGPEAVRSNPPGDG